MKAAGIVLCGGRSSRMGRPKAWLPVGPEVLLQRVVRVLRAELDPIVVVAAPRQDIPEIPASTIVARDNNEHLGPLNGLVAGLAALPNDIDVAYLSACDVPLLAAGFASRVISRIGKHAICIVEADGYLHPLAAAYRVDVLPTAQALVLAGKLRPVYLAEALTTQKLHVADFSDIDPALRSLRNINSPDEYDQVLRELGYAPAGPARPEERGNNG